VIVFDSFFCSESFVFWSLFSDQLCVDWFPELCVVCLIICSGGIVFLLDSSWTLCFPASRCLGSRVHGLKSRI